MMLFLFSLHIKSIIVLNLSCMNCDNLHFLLFLLLGHENKIWTFILFNIYLIIIQHWHINTVCI